MIEKHKTSNKLFPIKSAVLEIFGISRESLYFHLDKLHPQVNHRRSYEFEKNQSLIDWWMTQDKKASYFSSSMTNKLVTIIKQTNPNDSGSLLNLYMACEKWLINKSGGMSSRHGQVTALRNEIHDRLINQHYISKKRLMEIKEKIHHAHKFLQKGWADRSSYASFFKTAATDALDKVFENHGKAEQSEANDRGLLEAMDKWLGEKNSNVSKRYDLVLEMRNRLEESINTRYPNDATDEPNSGLPSISNNR